ncbi:hypothetical protein DUNSADRAFT_17852 [Dunaliella salina]|uniref:Uncharacterized protein n=1 Tax=Dunaliella salina TaxID=3046 RepID=A0ABQ7G109_DUNSA|nr:hypothetical protein DUNSADRAFT_17852 [Dunaliella salina]|eukprot:KAF5828290.1 hypothetical protein DUNSADRAFT_17852 [Dunaliella salina]
MSSSTFLFVHPPPPPSANKTLYYLDHDIKACETWQAIYEKLVQKAAEVIDLCQAKRDWELWTRWIDFRRRWQERLRLFREELCRLRSQRSSLRELEGAPSRGAIDPPSPSSSAQEDIDLEGSCGSSHRLLPGGSLLSNGAEAGACGKEGFAPSSFKTAWEGLVNTLSSISSIFDSKVKKE